MMGARVLCITPDLSTPNSSRGYGSTTTRVGIGSLARLVWVIVRAAARKFSMFLASSSVFFREIPLTIWKFSLCTSNHCPSHNSPAATGQEAVKAINRTRHDRACCRLRSYNHRAPPPWLIFQRKIWHRDLLFDVVISASSEFVRSGQHRCRRPRRSAFQFVQQLPGRCRILVVRPRNNRTQQRSRLDVLSRIRIGTRQQQLDLPIRR
jgi:hypothetical protein